MMICRILALWTSVHCTQLMLLVKSVRWDGWAVRGRLTYYRAPLLYSSFKVSEDLELWDSRLDSWLWFCPVLSVLCFVLPCVPFSLLQSSWILAFFLLSSDLSFRYVVSVVHVPSFTIVHLSLLLFSPSHACRVHGLLCHSHGLPITAGATTLLWRTLWNRWSNAPHTAPGVPWCRIRREVRPVILLSSCCQKGLLWMPLFSVLECALIPVFCCKSFHFILKHCA